MLCITIPGIGKISQGRPGIFFLANPLVGICHSIDRCRQRWWFFMPVSVILCHQAQDFKFHGWASLPKSWFRAFSIPGLLVTEKDWLYYTTGWHFLPSIGRAARFDSTFLIVNRKLYCGDYPQVRTRSFASLRMTLAADVILSEARI